MIAAIQLRGMVRMPGKVKDTLKMLNMGKKHSCVVLESSPVNDGMLEKCKDFIAYGKIGDDTAKKLKALAKGKTVHLHPPRGGFKSIKRAFPKGDLGPRDDMEKLIARMLP